MTYRFARLTLLGGLAALPLLQFSCSSDSEREFATGGTGGTGATGGSTTGGSAGSTAGTAGTATGGTAGSTGGSGGTTSDAGKPCANASECDDGDSCNGAETCDGGYCVGGTPAANGTTCTPANLGDAGSTTAEYICANGQCLGKCATDGDCDDSDVCTGKEICNPATSTCLSGTPPVCDDTNDCTENKCDPAGGCFYPLIDGDLDGHAADTLGACGDDCNDADKDIFVGAAELCDNKDNNCNGAKDELAPTWYVDCDKDSYPPAGAASTAQCQAPTTIHPTCGTSGGWTTKAPGTGVTDCWDKDAKAHPMTASENNTAWQSTAISGAPLTVDFDYNCDGSEEKEGVNPLSYKTSVSTTASCSKYGVIGTGGFAAFDEPAAGGGSGGVGGITATICYGDDGWTASTRPACGATGQFSNCGAFGTSCVRTTGSKTQRCR